MRRGEVVTLTEGNLCKNGGEETEKKRSRWTENLTNTVIALFIWNVEFISVPLRSEIKRHHVWRSSEMKNTILLYNLSSVVGERENEIFKVSEDTEFLLNTFTLQVSVFSIYLIISKLLRFNRRMMWN